MARRGDGLTLVTPPYAEPIDLAEAKLHLRVEHTHEDDLIAGLIVAAREYAEDVTGRQLVAATYRLTLDRFPPGGVIRLGTPLVSVSSVKYRDVTTGTLTTVAAADYLVDTTREPGTVEPAYEDTWPSPRWQANAIEVTYTVGHATPFTADASTDRLTLLGRTTTDGDVVRLTNSGGALPGGLSTLTDYYVRDTSGSTCKLSLTSGGAAIDLTTAGTGTSFLGVVPQKVLTAIRLLVGNWYENREATISGTIINEVPLAVEALLSSAWVGECLGRN